MKSLATTRAFYRKRDDMVVLKGRQWKGEFASADLDAWISFYRRMADRQGGKYRAFYQDSLDALEGVRAKIAENEGAEC